MMQRRTLVITLAIALLPTYPGEGIGQGIALREIEATRGSPAAPFGAIGDMLQIEDGRIIVTDDVSGVLHAWRPGSGEFSIFARSGRGPGEVVAPARLAPRPDGGFAVYDIGASMVQYFDRDGRPDGTTRLPGIVSNPKSMAIADDGMVWISGGRLTDPRHVHVFTPEGERIAAYGDPSPHLQSDYPKIQSAGGALRRDSVGRIFFSYGAPLRIVRFEAGSTTDPQLLTEDLEILPELREEEIYTAAPDIHPDARTFWWWHDRTTGVFALSDGRILNVITRYHRGDSVWDVYAPDGRLEHRRIVDKAYYAYHSTADGRILGAYRDPDTDEYVAVILEVQVEPSTLF